MDPCVLSSIEQLIRENRIPEAVLMCPVGLLDLKRLLVEKLVGGVEVCWWNALLKLPFSLVSILDAEEIVTLENRLCSHINAIFNIELEKVAVKNMALFINNIVLNGFEEKAVGILQGLQLPEVKFYSLLYEISKLNKSILKNIKGLKLEEISKNESTAVIGYKLKMLLNLATDGLSSVFNKIMEFANIKDTELGWTISKLIYKMSRFCNKQQFAEEIKRIMEKDIMGNEQLFISLISALSLIILGGAEVRDNRGLVLRSLRYVRGSEPRSESVREAGLFLLWSQIKTGCIVTEEELASLLCAALFDESRRCRMAASSVIFEYSGYWHTQKKETVDGIEESLKAFISSFSGSYNYKASINVFRAFPEKKFFEEYFLLQLASASFEMRATAAALISEFFNPTLFSYDPFSIHLNSYHLLVYMNNSNNMRDDNPFLLEKYSSSRHFHSIASVYLLIHKYVNLEYLKKNVMYLISKRYNQMELVLDVLEWLSSDESFMESIWRFVHRNGTWLLANTANEKYKSQLIKIFHQNLINKKIVPETLEAMAVSAERYGMKLDSELTALLYSFCDEYSLDCSGDAGYSMRRGAVLCLWYSGDPCCERYLIRFLADKSKKLRDELCELICGTRIFKQNTVNKLNFKRIVKDVVNCVKDENTKEHIRMKLPVSDKMARSLEEFIAKKEEYSHEFGLEESHFLALFSVFGCKDGGKDFMIGIINTLASADRRLFLFLEPFVRRELDTYIDLLSVLIADSSPFLLSSLKFCLLLNLSAPSLLGHLKNLNTEKMTRTAKLCYEEVLASCILGSTNSQEMQLS